MPRARKAISNSLADIQRTMLGAVRRPLTKDEEMQNSSDKIASAIIKPNDRLTSFARLEIYNQQYWWRLLGCLREDFRGLRAVLGEDAFERLAIEYLNAHPSRSWTLRNLGSKVPEFVTAHPELTPRRHALACDVANVEWARVVAFDDPAWPLVDAAKVGQTKQPVTIQPYVQLLELRHPVDKLMVKVKRREHQSASNGATRSTSRTPRRLSVAMGERAIHLAVHRVGFSLYYKRLDAEAAQLLRLLRDKSPLEEACVRAFENSTRPSSRWSVLIQEWFANWMELGWLCHAPKKEIRRRPNTKRAGL